MQHWKHLQVYHPMEVPALRNASVKAALEQLSVLDRARIKVASRQLAGKVPEFGERLALEVLMVIGGLWDDG